MGVRGAAGTRRDEVGQSRPRVDEADVDLLEMMAGIIKRGGVVVVM